MGAMLRDAFSTTPGKATFRRAIAATQVGLAVLSAAGAGLLVRTVVALNSVDPGLSAADMAVDGVLPGHFQALGIQVRSGRDLTELDNRSDSDPVVVVDEVLASALWPAVNPLGSGVVLGGGGNQTTYWVVGVVAATRYRELLVARPRAYFPLRRVGDWPPATLLVRTLASATVPIQELVSEAVAAA